MGDFADTSPVVQLPRSYEAQPDVIWPPRRPPQIELWPWDNSFMALLCSARSMFRNYS